MVELDNYPKVTEALENYITSSIIPNMNKRRGKEIVLTQNEIHEKFHRGRASGHEGELREFEAEIRRNTDGIDGQFASEIADLIYYSSQDNCSSEDVRVANDWLEFFDIPRSIALEFCIVKYETRLKGAKDVKDHQLENQKLDQWIDKFYPYLKTIWQNPS